MDVTPGAPAPRNRGGRPKLPAALRRSQVISIALTEAEYLLLGTAAPRGQLAPAARAVLLDWARAGAPPAPAPERPPAEDPATEALRELRDAARTAAREAARIGSNLNRLARIANRERRVPPGTAETAREAAAAVERMTRELARRAQP